MANMVWVIKERGTGAWVNYVDDTHVSFNKHAPCVGFYDEAYAKKQVNGLSRKFPTMSFELCRMAEDALEA